VTVAAVVITLDRAARDRVIRVIRALAEHEPGAWLDVASGEFGYGDQVVRRLAVSRQIDEEAAT
jgi:hypothetical protein